MAELAFAYNYDTDIAGLAGLDFEAGGKICIMVGDIAPQGVLDEIWYELFDTQQTIYDIADDLKEDLGELYPNADITVDKDTSFTEFRKSVFTLETIGVVFIGHGEKGRLSLSDNLFASPSLAPTPTDLQFLFLFTCEAGMEVEGSWKSLTQADVYYASEEELAVGPTLPFLDSLASEANRMVEELRLLKGKWFEKKADR
jgi:hypothetical protein